MASRRFVLDVAALTAAGFAIRLLGIERTTLWYDEVQTARAVAMPAAALVRERLAEMHSPIYFLLLKVLGVSTDSIVEMRLPSAVFGAATVAVGMLAARALHSRRAGWIAGLLFAFTPILIDYGQEARPYAAMLFGVVLALWGAARVLRHPRAAMAALRLPGPDARSRRRAALWTAWLPLAGGSIWAFAMLPLGVLLWPSLDLSYACTAWLAAGATRRLARGWLVHRLVCAIVCLPLVVALAPQVGPRIGDYWFVAPSSAGLARQIIRALLFGFQGDPDALLGAATGLILAALLLLIAVRGALSSRLRLSSRAILLSSSLLPVAIIGVATLHTPVWLDRYLLLATPAFTLMLAVGFAGAWRRRWGRAITVAAAILIALQLGDLQRGSRRADWRPLIAEVAAARTPVFLVAAHEHQVREIGFEWRRERLPGAPRFARFGVDGHPRDDADYLVLREPDLGVPLRGLAAGIDRRDWVAWLERRGVVAIDLAPARSASAQVGVEHRPSRR